MIRARAYHSRNGSRIPNPYVDNAQPNETTTWATVEGHHVQVATYPNGGRYPGYRASLRSYPLCVASGIGPSEAVGRLDAVLGRRMSQSRLTLHQPRGSVEK